MPELFKKLLKEGIEYTVESEGRRYTHIIPGAFPRINIVDWIETCPQVEGYDCGWWSVYNAIMIVFTGDTMYLDQFKLKDEELTREPGYKLRALLPKLTNEAEVEKKRVID